MKRKIYLKILLFTFPLLLFTNCGKEECTDPIAHNFDPSATKNDGKCFYGLTESSASFTISPTSNPNVVVFKADKEKRCLCLNFNYSPHDNSFTIV